MYVVTCCTSEAERASDEKERVLATRRIFLSAEAAGRYAATINRSRFPDTMALANYLIAFEGWRYA